MQQNPIRPAEVRFILIAAGLGIIVGGAAMAFHRGANLVLKWHETVVSNVPTEWAIPMSASVSAAMVVLACWLVRRFAPEAAGSGVHEIEGAMEGVRSVRWKRILPVKFVGGIMSIGSGLVVGREGPTIHIGASIARGLQELFRLPNLEGRGLIAAGAAAGLAAAFNAPLAAILFVIEETRRQFKYTFSSYTGVMVATVLATIVTEQLGGMAPDLSIISKPFPLSTLPFLAILGAVLGAGGVVFNSALLRALDLVDTIKSKTSWWLVPAVVGAGIGALLVVWSPLTHGGEDLVADLVQQSWPLWVLMGLVFLRGITTLASYAVGAPGGIFAPLLALATLIGLMLHALFATVMPDLMAGQAAGFAIAAMAGLFASSVRAPLVGVVLVAELTGGFDLMLGVLVTAGVSHVTAHLLHGAPIYEVLLDRTLTRAGANPVPPSEDLPVELGYSAPVQPSATEKD